MLKRSLLLFACIAAGFAGISYRQQPVYASQGLLPPAPSLSELGESRTTIPLLPADFSLDRVVGDAARKHQVLPGFIKSIIAAESGFHFDALSPKGAVGFMQLMPTTAEDMGLDAYIPEQNIEAGTKYLGWLLRRYQKSKDPLRFTIAAYNAGPGTVDRYRGVPPYSETRAYVTRVLGYYKRFEGMTLVKIRKGRKKIQLASYRYPLASTDQAD